MKQHIDLSHIIVFVLLVLLLIIALLAVVYQTGYNHGIDMQKNSSQCKVTTTAGVSENSIIPCVRSETLTGATQF